ncbi:MAG TPA: UrcA family protein [Steroidobacteraceae bacterium]|nr:UrcA family protein [Steroidobacteraceae bacterium]
MTIKLVAVSAAAALVAGVALGQGVPEVKVEATRVIASGITAKTVGRTSSGVPIKDITLSYGVSAEGLDLSTHTGALAFEQRVKDAAEQACQDIGRQYPDATPSEAACAKAAADQAMVRVHELVASAEKIRTATK